MAIKHPLINEVAGGVARGVGWHAGRAVLADRLRISRVEASRRVHERADLGERRALTGEPVAPVLAATAATQRSGQIGAGQVTVIRSFWHRLPAPKPSSPR